MRFSKRTSDGRTVGRPPGVGGLFLGGRRARGPGHCLEFGLGVAREVGNLLQAGDALFVVHVGGRAFVGFLRIKAGRF